jgi:hypothetical protein
MSPFPTFILSILLSITPLSAAVNNARWPVSPPIVVLEATSITRSQGSEIHYLLVRLTDDGTVEWDKYVGNAWKRQTSSVSAEKVSKIQRTLDSIDKNRLHGAMGPYHVYEDTSDELRIQMTTRQGEIAFSVTNPWPEPGMPRRKRMPKEVRLVVCEVDGLYAQTAGVPVQPMCKASTSPHQR